jgi:uncharacterized protein YjbI with pentapeptide repeats
MAISLVRLVLWVYLLFVLLSIISSAIGENPFKDHALLMGMNLSGRNLSGTSLNHSELQGSDLRGTNLFRSFSVQAVISNANLTGANP